MLPRALLLTLLLAVAFAPTGAAKPACATSPSDDATAAWPLNPDTYLYTGAHGERGFWSESNHQDGLQVQDCAANGGLYYYRADRYLGTSFPADALL